MTLPEGTVTFLRSDIEGSMKLVRALGARYDELNAEHRDLVRAAVAECDGQVVRTEGDAFFVVFTDAGAAARAAVAIQTAMAGHDWPEGHQFKLRIGIHSGSAVRAGDDYGGFEVNRAARIAALGAGGQIILSDPARALVVADLPAEWSIGDLGQHRLKGVSEPEQLFQLDAPGLEHAFEPLRSEGGASRHLPPRVTSFIGRERELEELDQLLRANRLLTLTGPGGTGKTTLALELARRHAAHMPDGTHFVDLQAVTDPKQVQAEIARGLGLFDGTTGSAADRLMAFIEDRHMLVVVDNFEQVIDAAVVVGKMLQTSPGSRFIVTSRGPLQVSGEQEYAVRPLDAGDGSAPAVSSESVRLFVDRVRSVRPAASLEGEDLHTAADICRFLDGLPLAIELTAARASSLPLALIRDRIKSRLPLPGSAPRDLPDRQKTIDATVAWSYDLLEPPLRHLFERLSVFAESFDLAQAEVVVGSTEEVGIDPLEGIFQLAQESLLTRVDDAIGGVRFRMLETVRTFARERLRERAEEGEIARRHATAYAALADSAASNLPSSEQSYWLDRLDVDTANLREAAGWAIDNGEAGLAASCAAAPWRFWLGTGRLTEAYSLVHQALALKEARGATRARVRLLAGAGGLAYWSGRLEEAHRCYEEQLLIATELDDVEGRAEANLNLAYTRMYTGDLEGRDAARVEARRLYEELADEDAILLLEWGITFGAISPNEPDDLIAAEEVADRLEARGGNYYRSMALTTRGLIAQMRGDEVGLARMYVTTMRTLLGLHDFAEASFGLQPIVGILAGAGHDEAAAVTNGVMQQTWTRLGVKPPMPFWELTGHPDPIPGIKARLGDDAWEQAMQRGRRTELEPLLDHIEALLGPFEDAPDEVRTPSAS